MVRQRSQVIGNSQLHVRGQDVDKPLYHFRRGSGEATGPVSSTMTAPDEENSRELGSLAIAGNVPGLIAYLEANPDADVNSPERGQV